MREAREWIALLERQKSSIEERDNRIGRGFYIATDIKEERKNENDSNQVDN